MRQDAGSRDGQDVAASVGPVLERLGRIPTPTIANALEILGLDPAEGFTEATLQLYGGNGPFVGRALTATMRSAVRRTEDEMFVATETYWRYVARDQGPRIVVVQDLDEEPVGAMYGEVQGRLHRGLGVTGIVSNGAVRDTAELAAIDFPVLAARLCVSHAHARFTALDVPVTVAGLVIKPGDLIHADHHGVQLIPADTDLAALAALVVEIEERERELFDAADGIVSIDGFLDTWRDVRTRWPNGTPAAADSI